MIIGDDIDDMIEMIQWIRKSKVLRLDSEPAPYKVKRLITQFANRYEFDRYVASRVVCAVIGYDWRDYQ